MKRRYFLYLSATVVVVAVVWSSVRHNGGKHAVWADHHHSRIPEPVSHGSPAAPLRETSLAGVVAASEEAAALPPPEKLALTKNAPAIATPAVGHGANRSSGRPSAGGSVVDPENTVKSAPHRGIQLAESVKLPAAVMALADPGFRNLTPQQNAALQAVVDTFYQDLAASTETRLANNDLTGGKLVVSPEGEETVVVQPGPDVDKARQRANEVFRALFGDDRYNQVTMQSAMEAMLPPSAGLESE